MEKTRHQALESAAQPVIGRLYEVELLRELEDDGAPAAAGNEARLLPTALELEPEAGAEEEAEAEDYAAQPLPFVDRIAAYAPGRSATVERWLSLDEDLLLADHIFVHAPGVKPLSACLPIVPMTLSLEIMAETAACLAPGYGLVGFEEVKATRWIELADTSRLRLRIHAELARFDAESEVCHIAVSIYAGDQTYPAIQGRALFAPHYLLELAPVFTEPSAVRSLSAADIYAERHMFHGPAYQCLVGDILVGEQGAAGELWVKDTAGLFRSTARPQLLTDPTLLDGVGQLFGIWAIAHGRSAFPIGFKKLEIYRPRPPVGTRVPIRLEITRDEGKSLYADVEIQDGNGGVWMRVQDWGAWKFRWDSRLLDFRRLPTRYLLGEAVELPGLAADAVCVTVAPAVLAGFDAGLLARFYLHLDEMAAFDGKRGFERRQQHWLLGRIAVKDAARAWWAGRDGAAEMAHPAAFAIAQDDQGQPRIHPASAGARPPRLSIAHCEDRAIAIAHGGTVGVDIEPIAVHDPEVVASFASEAERRLLAEAGGAADPPGEWTTRLWCAKEAAGKFLGLGLNGSPKTYEAQRLDRDGIVPILHRGSGRTILVRTLRQEAFIVAYASAEAGT